MDAARFTVAICGGGIAGLTLAISLHRFTPPEVPLRVDIYETDPEVRTAGAGITIWPRTWDVMRHLGLHTQLSEVAVRAAGGPSGINETELRPAFVARKADQPRDGYQFCQVNAPAGSTTMHRKDMIDVFLRNFPPSCTLHASKRVVKYTSSGGASPVTLHFADGTTADADVLVGADGIHSAVRMCMYEKVHREDCNPGVLVLLEECARCAATIPTWTGICAYRFLIPTEKLYALNPAHTTARIGAVLCYSGKGKHIVTYQISGGKFLNFVALCRTPGGEGTPYTGKWVADVPREEVASQFDGWEPEVQQMLQCNESPTCWAVHVVDNLPFAASGCVALLGDAMHAMPPNFGAGGGQAIEDAFILGRLLADPRVSLAHVPSALRLYESIRLPFTMDISRRGRDVGLMYEFNAPGFFGGTSDSESIAPSNGAKSEKEQLDELGEAIHRMWEWQWTEGLDEQWVQAEEELEAIVDGTPRSERVH